MWLWEDQGGLLGPFSFLLLLLLLVTRSPFNACLLTGSLFVLLRFFSFEQVPSDRALQVLKPRDRISAIAHRGGSHDAPENTLAAIRQTHIFTVTPTWHLDSWTPGQFLLPFSTRHS
uniref:Glycerophosphodiester phosphodiesterase 1 n=1 Tax=Urocitellus parryii TaxID=9999 RepID=A0A8D2HF61_UROPR